MSTMTIESSDALADLIKRVAAGTTIGIQQSKGTAYIVEIGYDEKSLRFMFDQGGKVPDEADCISTLWARAAVISRGESAFYDAFYEKAYEAYTEGSIPLKPEYEAHYEEWKRCAEESWQVFGDWFGRKWE